MVIGFHGGDQLVDRGAVGGFDGAAERVDEEFFGQAAEEAVALRFDRLFEVEQVCVLVAVGKCAG